MAQLPLQANFLFPWQQPFFQNTSFPGGNVNFRFTNMLHFNPVRFFFLSHNLLKNYLLFLDCPLRNLIMSRWQCLWVRYIFFSPQNASPLFQPSLNSLTKVNAFLRCLVNIDFKSSCKLCWSTAGIQDKRLKE